VNTHKLVDNYNHRRTTTPGQPTTMGKTELLLRILRNVSASIMDTGVTNSTNGLADGAVSSHLNGTGLTTSAGNDSAGQTTFGGAVGDRDVGIESKSSTDALLEFGGHTYVITLLSVLVLLAILFTLCGLFHKAEAHTKSDLDDSLLFQSRHNNLLSSYFDAPSTTSLI
jgi:hypothetical protein